MKQVTFRNIQVYITISFTQHIKKDFSNWYTTSQLKRGEKLSGDHHLIFQFHSSKDERNVQAFAYAAKQYGLMFKIRASLGKGEKVKMFILSIYAGQSADHSMWPLGP